MENRIIFREMLSEIKAAADAAGNIITREEIKKFFQICPLRRNTSH